MRRGSRGRTPFAAPELPRLGWVLAAVAGAVALALVAGAAARGWGELAAVRAQERRLSAERRRLEREVERLEATLRALDRDPGAVEALARRELGWVRPGEEVLILATPTPVPPPPLTGPPPTPILSLSRATRGGAAR